MNLEEKLTMVKAIDAAILDLVEEDNAVTVEIEESNVFKGEIYTVMVKIDEFLSIKLLALWTCVNQTILLQTAQAVVFNSDNPQRSMKVQVTLDLESQRSYCTTRLKRDLALCKLGEQDLPVMTFGSSGQSPCACEVVKVGLRLIDGETRHLTLFTVPMICEPIACQRVSICQAKFSHFSDLALADSSDGQTQMSVNILIGADQYWSLTTRRIWRAESGPVAVQTKSGWVLSGPVECLSQHRIQTSLVTHALHIDSTLSPDYNTLDATLKMF